jgi:hypothetical protein
MTFKNQHSPELLAIADEIEKTVGHLGFKVRECQNRRDQLWIIHLGLFSWDLVCLNGPSPSFQVKWEAEHLLACVDVSNGLRLGTWSKLGEWPKVLHDSVQRLSPPDPFAHAVILKALEGIQQSRQS